MRANMLDKCHGVLQKKEKEERNEKKKKNRTERGGFAQRYLPQHQLSVHVHGEVAEVEQHLVGGELLLRHVLPVQNDDGHTQEEVEVVSLRRSKRRLGDSTKRHAGRTTQSPRKMNMLLLTVSFCFWPKAKQIGA